MSHYRQPWRGYLETRGGYEFLSGLGVNLHIPSGTEEVAIRLLAETGFKTFRIEIGWGELNWNETGWNNEVSLRRRLELCAQYGIRPTLLLNAHQGVPCPLKFFDRHLMADAPKGAHAVRLDNVQDLVVGRSGLSGLSDYWAAEALITSINAETGEVTLSKPLPKDLQAGVVPMATLKYAPLHPVASPEFGETAGGWVNYALRVCQLAEQCNDYMTEHGILASECGVGDAAGAWRLKALCATRSFCLWLNKGVDVLDYFDAYEPEATSYGLLPANLNDLSPQVRFDEVATPPMRATRNLARAFDGSVPLSRIDPLGVDAASLGPESKVFEGDATHPPLWQREVLAVLPFQVNPRKHVVAVYLMTRDALKVLPPETFRLTFNGVKSNHVEAMDVLSGAPVPIHSKSLGPNKVEVTLGVTETPITIALGE
jgi:hypothetical protein